MIITTIRQVNIRTLLLLSITWIFPCYGQEIDAVLLNDEAFRARIEELGLKPDVVLEEALPSAQQSALGLLSDYQLVADGEFVAFPEFSDEEMRTIERKKVRVKFRIHKLFQGSSEQFTEIELSSDMLKYPGEAISRHMKRKQVRNKGFLEFQELRRQAVALEQSFYDRKIDRQEYERRMNQINVSTKAWIKNQNSVSEGWGFAFGHKRTFYELGGFIGPNERFLLGLNAIKGVPRIYALNEVSGATNIYWGEMRDHMLGGLEKAKNPPEWWEVEESRNKR